MVIDLHRCVGCGACDLACKSENNTPVGIDWASHKVETHGVFPKVTYKHTPTLCNHCEDAPCVRVCPTRAMHKNDIGMVVHDPSICIGCKSCMLADPYKVISFNKESAFLNYVTDDSSIVKGGTFSKKELSEKSGAPFLTSTWIEMPKGMRRSEKKVQLKSVHSVITGLQKAWPRHAS
jgi:Fe-S-cluster-containing dehydrogenase component